MAKNSMIARENKRTRAVKRFATKRAELKAIIKSTTSSYDERYAGSAEVAAAAA